MATILSVQQLGVYFDTREGPQKAVKNVSFDLEQGQTLGIVGESGSGKSVCCYSLLGLLPMPPARVESGKAIFEGRDLLSLNEKALRKVRGSEIAMIFQDPMTSLNPYLTIGAQLTEGLHIHQRVSAAAAKDKAIALLEEVGIKNPSVRFSAYPHEFSGGMRQRVMIAMALIAEPKILIADEPTTALDVTVQAQVLALIKKIQTARQLSVIFISHDLAVVKQIADNVIVMRDGEIIERGAAEQLFLNPSHIYTQCLVAASPCASKQALKRDGRNLGHPGGKPDILLKLDALSVEYFVCDSRSVWRQFFRRPTLNKVIDSVSLELNRGEILGLVGESGSGKSTLGKSIVNLVPPSEGYVIYQGKNLTLDRKKYAVQAAREIQIIFQDPYASLNPRMTVFDTLAEPLLKFSIVDKQGLSAAVNKIMDEVGLDRNFVRRYPHEFSGGQRQRIAIGRALASRPKLIIADEPVSALDVTVQADIMRLLQRLNKTYGLTILFISHDLAVVRALADRVAVMTEGKIVELGTTESLFECPAHEYTRKLLKAIIS